MSTFLDLAGRRALVTGGTRGIGRAVAATLRDAGARVLFAARSLPAQPASDIHYIAADLTTAAGASATAQAVDAQFGGVDIVVHVLGGSSAPAGGHAALDDAQWAMALDQNLMPAVRLDRALLPGMLAQRAGVIVHVSSIQAVLPLP